MNAPVTRSRSTDQRYHGVYEALVADVNDPLKEGRVKIRMPWFDEQMVTEWCRVRQFYAGNGYGGFFIPEVGDEVLIAFIQGDMRYPIILGGLYNGSDKPPSHRDDSTDQKMVRTKGGHVLLLDDSLNPNKQRVSVTTIAGHVLLLDDKPDEQRVRLTTNGGHEVDLSDADQKVVVKTKGGNTVSMEDEDKQITIKTSGGQSITMTPGTITLSAASIVIKGSSVMLGSDSASSPLVLGDQLLALFNAHVHACTAPGSPSSPPVVPLTPAVLSMIAKTS